MEYIHNREAFLRHLYQHCHCVNAGQSQEERRTKYKIIRLLGHNYKTAMQRRDWPINKIARAEGFRSYKELLKAYGVEE